MSLYRWGSVYNRLSPGFVNSSILGGINNGYSFDNPLAYSGNFGGVSSPYNGGAGFTEHVAPATNITPSGGGGWGALGGWQRIGIGATILNGISSMFDKTALNMSRNYSSMAQQAASNAGIAKQQNLQTGIAGANEANAMRERGDRMESTARTGYGASGVASNEGSAADVQAGIAGRTEADAQTIRQNTLMKQWALTAEQRQYETQARNYTKMSNYYAKQYNNQWFTGLLNTALGVAKIYYGG